MMARSHLRMAATLAAIFCLGGCASYGGSGLEPGRSGLADVEGRLGAPARRWQEPDGSQLLAYPRGPAGFHTYMARIAPDGRLVSLENVLEPRHFARIQPGMSQDDVLRLIGPPYPSWTTYFEARDELVWEWRYCDDWGEAARFDVLMDGTSGKVRSTLTTTESLRYGTAPAGLGRVWCSR